MIFLGKELGPSHYPFITAEISCNHEGNTLQLAALIQAAKDSGADAVKIQVYTADDMTYIKHIGTAGFYQEYVSDDFIIKEGPWKGKALGKLYQRTQTCDAMIGAAFDTAAAIGIPIFASVFSPRVIPILEEYKCPAYKIASFEITDTNLIRKAAKTGKSMVISAGLASLSDIDQAMLCVNPENTVLLHCVSAYPTKIEQANLWKMQSYSQYFNCPIGFSDHTRGIFVGPLACAMGAVMVEKHLQLPMTVTEDSAFSLYPNEFEQYVTKCRAARSARFNTEVPDEEYSKQFRRSLYVVKDVHKGDLLTYENIRAIRPSYGYPAQMLNIITSGGMHFRKDIKAGTALKSEDFA